MELILVMVIMFTLLAVAAPKLTGWGQGSKLRDTADEFLAAARWARIQAVASGNVHAIVVEPGASAFSVRVQQNQTYASVDGPYRNPVLLPEGGRIDAVNTATPIDTIRFYPSNRVDPARVRLSDSQGRTISVQCLAPSEEFVKVAEQ